jgi:hypothetical protein
LPRGIVCTFKHHLTFAPLPLAPLISVRTNPSMPLDIASRIRILIQRISYLDGMIMELDRQKNRMSPAQKTPLTRPFWSTFQVRNFWIRLFVFW